MWDGVFGLTRFIASWFSEGGRKGELVQTHYFASAFGERINTGGGIHVDFYLLPTFEELIDLSNPLSLFPKFASLIAAAAAFSSRFCDPLVIGTSKFGAFRMAKTGLSGQLNTAAILNLCDRFSGLSRDALFETYNAFNRGPTRTVVALLMLHDLRIGNWDPRTLTAATCADMYTLLAGSYQTPKVIQLYAQQCFASTCALPIDNWVQTFLKWPLGFVPTSPKHFHAQLFACSSVWGKLERLIWMASQARKVHSVAASDILWCVRFGGPKKEMRGANPLACKVCAVHLRNVCPAFQGIRKSTVQFNALAAPPNGFLVRTEGTSASASHQAITTCVGPGVYDEYTVRDRKGAFAPYPAPGHHPPTIDVDTFIALY